jgi:hypothetical protein
MASAFFVRWIHVTSASVLIGGALLVIILSLTWAYRDESQRHSLLELMQIYEVAFWAGIGLIVMSGVGNIAHFGEGLPQPESMWGHKFTIKLLLVVIFLILSLVRSLSVGLVRGLPDNSAELRMGVLTGMYGGTLLLVLTILGFAMAMSHFPSL